MKNFFKRSIVVTSLAVLFFSISSKASVLSDLVDAFNGLELEKMRYSPEPRSSSPQLRNSTGGLRISKRFSKLRGSSVDLRRSSMRDSSKLPEKQSETPSIHSQAKDQLKLAITFLEHVEKAHIQIMKDDSKLVLKNGLKKQLDQLVQDESEYSKAIELIYSWNNEDPDNFLRSHPIQEKQAAPHYLELMLKTLKVGIEGLGRNSVD